MNGPRLDTPRLTLAPPTLADFDEIAALWAEPSVALYTGGVPSSREASWARLLRYAGSWSLLGYGFWSVRERATGRYAGDVGLLEGHRDIEPSYEGTPEAGWALAPWAQGKGYATEAVQAALAWADATLAAERVVCLIELANAPSLRVAARCGFEPWVETAYKHDPVQLLQRARRHG